MKKLLIIASILVFVIVSSAILIFETYFYAYDKGYDQCVKDNYFTITPETGWISVDTLYGDSAIKHMKDFKYYRISVNCEIKCHSKKM